MDFSRNELASWFARAIAVMAREAERAHEPLVQRRAQTALEASARATAKPFEPRAVGAIQYLEPFVGHESPLLSEFAALAPNVPWSPSDRVDGVGDGDRGASVALLDLSETLELDLAGAGVMVLGPNAGYPEHCHAPAEVYLILHGSRRWRFGGSDKYVTVDEGNLLSNASMDIHGVEPNDQPLVALWVLTDE